MSSKSYEASSNMKESKFRAWIEVNSRQAVLVLGTIATLGGLGLFYSYSQILVSQRAGQWDIAIVLSILLPGFAALCVGALFFTLGSIQGILQDGRADQRRMTRQIAELLQQMVDENRQRTQEIELLAEAIDERD